jgi:major membrane immunogen (membrane-anchored lipoprotein)
MKKYIITLGIILSLLITGCDQSSSTTVTPGTNNTTSNTTSTPKASSTKTEKTSEPELNIAKDSSKSTNAICPKLG